MKPGPKPMTIEQKIAKHSAFDENGCLIWHGPVFRNGYAKASMWHDGKWKTVYVHRELMNAQPQDVVRHICDVRRCVNRDHLRIGTQMDNVQDMIAKQRGWWQNAARTGAS